MKLSPVVVNYAHEDRQHQYNIIIGVKPREDLRTVLLARISSGMLLLLYSILHGTTQILRMCKKKPLRPAA